MQRGIFLLILVFASLARVSGQTTLTTSNDTTICLGGTATLSATIIIGKPYPDRKDHIELLAQPE